MPGGGSMGTGMPGGGGMTTGMPGGGGMTGGAGGSPVTQQKFMDDIVTFWRQFRDPQNGFWCDNLLPNDLRPCGAQNNFYSAAGTGMGLVSEAIMVELGYQT